MGRSMTTTRTLRSNKKDIHKELLNVTERNAPSHEVVYDEKTDGKYHYTRTSSTPKERKKMY